MREHLTHLTGLSISFFGQQWDQLPDKTDVYLDDYLITVQFSFLKSREEHTAFKFYLPIIWQGVIRYNFQINIYVSDYYSLQYVSVTTTTYWIFIYLGLYL